MILYEVWCRMEPLEGVKTSQKQRISYLSDSSNEDSEADWHLV